MSTDQMETMTVTVRDRSAEAPRGVGLTNPVTRKITISAFCPVDGQRRGEPRGLNQHEDGVSYSVQVWRNPCGHMDLYADVIREARAIATAKEARRIAAWNPPPGAYISKAFLPPLPCPDGHCEFMVCGDCSHRGFTRQHLGQADGICPNGHRSDIAAPGHAASGVRDGK